MNKIPESAKAPADGVGKSSPSVQSQTTFLFVFKVTRWWAIIQHWRYWRQVRSLKPAGWEVYSENDDRIYFFRSAA